MSILPSSPPLPAGEHRAPSLEDESNYALDLAALGPESEDDISIPKEKFDRIFSQDIDGPSDFTLNMEKWMRGGTLKRKGTAKSPVLVGLEEQHQEMVQTGDFQSKQQDAPNSPHTENGAVEGEPTTSHHTPENSPPKESVWMEEAPPERDGHMKSDWDLYSGMSREGGPHPPKHRQCLQPTVEDYYSELTPAHNTATQENNSPRRSRSPSRTHVSPLKLRSSSPGHPSMQNPSPALSPVIQRSMPSQQYSEQDIYEQLHQLIARCKDLEYQNAVLSESLAEERRLRKQDQSQISALKQALDEEQRIRKQEKALHAVQISDAVRRENDLTEMKMDADKRAEDFRADCLKQKDRVRKLEADINASKQERERWNSHDSAELEMLREELEYLRQIHEESKKSALDQARRAREDAREAARIHREEMEDIRNAHDEEIERLKKQINKMNGVRMEVAELNVELQDAKDEIARLRAAKVGDVDEKIDLKVRTEISEGESARMSADWREAESLRQQLEALRTQINERQSTHDSEIHQLQASQQIVPDSNTPAINTDTQSVLNDAILERDAAKDSLAALQAAHKDLQTQIAILQCENNDLKVKIEDADVVNVALDARISEALRKRESYWRARLEESEKERRVMVKTLLHQWGREELGVGIPQAYEYMYVSSQGHGSQSSTKAGA
ncbi:hypothetical protein M433DRAFT_149812 [Acidomyces richmondensis BFW]|nr:MAG: hypothetical protein FE78DRAFT_92850 [Acidomyces sp. 'richmondensis']KYG49591.1 hypothetical protein M433DRAFT_149812 [Acidomyces richmondensis BFW]